MSSVVDNLLTNRGITDCNRWLSASMDEIKDWRSLGERQIIDAIRIIDNVVNRGGKICIVVDSDCDGFTSSAILINYLNGVYPWYHNLKYVMHEGKQHGLSDVMCEIDDDTDIVISPDGGSNDIDCHKRLYQRNGTYVLVLDHHDIDIDPEDSPANIINVQISDYPDKALTGAGVCWQFVRAYDEIMEHSLSDSLFDLAAIGDCGDMADYREYEIRSIVYNGLKHLSNKFYSEMALAHDFSIQRMNGLNYYSCAFYIVPFVNAVCRSGSMEEKTTVFAASLNSSCDDLVYSSKRGQKGMKVPLYKEAITVVERVKRRQTALQNDEMKVCNSHITDESLLDSPLLAIRLQPNEGEPQLNGLVANKLQEQYKRPSIVMITYDTDRGVIYRGSCRNYSFSPLTNLRTIINDTGLALAQGHEQACGIEMMESDFDAFMDRMRDVYDGIDMTPSYIVDYDWSMLEADGNIILDIAHMDIYGQQVPESRVSVHDIDPSICRVDLLGKDKNTIKITLPNGVSIISFKSNQEVYDSIVNGGIVIDVVGKCSDNYWNGTHYPQIIVEDWDMREEYIF